MLTECIFQCREHVHGLTPLMHACAAGHAITVQFFLQHVRIYYVPFQQLTAFTDQNSLKFMSVFPLTNSNTLIAVDVLENR